MIVLIVCVEVITVLTTHADLKI